ncbi:translation initiation factor IF-2 [Proteiniborus ethanoligenes]|uniref:Translation initiation factor IF-2 n=1 Tax=Proteiniborus ethanoligenes TaxID=415015 RepID=A0A1H3N6J1_9FIRM|nr:translation initiation factor IF-2 [Proteiniborus ethanoligenes]SDY84567.1 translation initiation factor IF-2 [Proteiniborus ethanoligenes]
MTKVRVYELAKELGISNKELVNKLNELDIKVGNHMSSIEAEEAELVKEFISSEEEEKDNLHEESSDINKKKKSSNTKPKKANDADKKANTSKKNYQPEKKSGEESNVNINVNIIEVGNKIQVKDLAEKINISPNKLISKLINFGVMAGINQEIDFDTASIIASEFNYELRLDKKTDEEESKDKSYDSLDFEDPEESLQLRPPVVTVMGHVDHGKTSLLDAIRETNVTQKEAGGITQHIGASAVTINNKKVVLLDTPGHEAFTSMRARGAQITDIAIVVVAADDGVMPQTIEAINHAKAANIPIIVAINKVDKSEANPDRVKQELTEHGLVPEDWGGDTIFVPVSALKRMGIDELLEMILLVAEMQELKANPNRKAMGTIIEAKLDKGRGPVATVLVQKGSLSIGDAVVAGAAYGRVRAMLDDRGKRVKKVGPSTPVEILGLSEVPEAGEHLYVVEDDKKAREVATRRKEVIRNEQLKVNQKVSLEDLFERIKQGEVKDLNIIIKADVKGSIEAVKQSLEKLSTDEVKVNPIHGGVGAITESDIMLASASNAIVIGFNVRPTNTAMEIANKENVDVRTYRVIYTAIEDIEAAIKGMLTPEYKEVVLGRAEIRATFKVPNVGVVAGVYVQQGKILRNAKIRLLRDNIVIHEGSISSLKRFKDDVRELLSGYEGGLGIDGYNDVKESDVIEAYTFEEIQK